MLVFCRTMKEDLNQKQVCGSSPDHHKAAAHLTYVHSVLNNCQNPSTLRELFYFNTRNCSLFNIIPLPSIDKEMPLTLSESAGRNSSAPAPWKELFDLHFSSGTDSADRVSHCINSISVAGLLEKACRFPGDFSSCCPGDNFVHFAQFWLENLQYNKNLQFLELKLSEENELQLAFLKELEFDGLTDLCAIPAASLNEDAMGLLNQKPCFFLCYLILVSSEQTPGYKQMLSNIQYVTNNFHIVQLVISMLAFALAGLWYEVARVKKY